MLPNLQRQPTSRRNTIAHQEVAPEICSEQTQQAFFANVRQNLKEFTEGQRVHSLTTQSQDPEYSITRGGAPHEIATSSPKYSLPKSA